MVRIECCDGSGDPGRCLVFIRAFRVPNLSEEEPYSRDQQCWITPLASGVYGAMLQVTSRRGHSLAEHVKLRYFVVVVVLVLVFVEPGVIECRKIENPSQSMCFWRAGPEATEARGYRMDDTQNTVRDIYFLMFLRYSCTR
jgi:hypothetical protein